MPSVWLHDAAEKCRKTSDYNGVEYRLLAVCLRRQGKTRFYRQPTSQDLLILKKAEESIKNLSSEKVNGIPVIPNEELPYLRSIFNVRVYGIDKWAKLFHLRQLVSAITLNRTRDSPRCGGASGAASTQQPRPASRQQTLRSLFSKDTRWSSLVVLRSRRYLPGSGESARRPRPAASCWALTQARSW